MKEFVKNNLSFVIFLGISALIALFLIYMDFTQYTQLRETLDTINKNGDEIQRVNKLGSKAPEAFVEDPEASNAQNKLAFEDWNKKRKNMRIIEGNIALINEDTALLQERVETMQRVFGHIYDDEFDAFMNVLTAPAVIDGFPAAEDTEAVKKAFALADNKMSPEELDAKLKDYKMTAKDSDAVKKSFDKAMCEVSRKSFADLFKKVYDEEKVEEMLNETRDNDKKFTAAAQKKVFEAFRTKFVNSLSMRTFNSEDVIAAAYQKVCFEKLAKTRFDAAFKEFSKGVDKFSYIPLIPENLRAKYPDIYIGAFFQVFGLQMVIPNNQFMEFIQTLAAAMEKDIAIAKNARVMSDAQTMRIFGTKREALVKLFWDLDTPPAQDMMGHLMRRIEIYEYLFKMLAHSGKAQVFDLKQTSDISGKLVNKGLPYRAYTFTLTVTGSMQNIRDFINVLHDGYKDNRVIAMWNLSIKVNDGSEGAFDANAMSNDTQEFRVMQALSTKYNAALKTTANSGKAADNKAAAVVEVKKEKSQKIDDIVKSDPNYGAVAMGNVTEVSATFVFNYILYVGDSLPAEGK